MHTIQIECNETCCCRGKHATPVTYMQIGTCTYSCVCSVPIGYMHIILEASLFHWTHAFLVGYRLFMSIASVGHCTWKGWSCAHLVGAVMPLDCDLHTIDAQFFVQRLHTIYIIVHTIQIECNETCCCRGNMQSMFYTYALVHALECNVTCSCC